MSQKFESSIELPFPQEDIESYMSHDEATYRLTPPWQNITSFKSKENTLQFNLKEHRLLPSSSLKIKKEIQSPSSIHYTQIKGHYAKWEQKTNIVTSLNNTTLINQHVHYTLPFSLFKKQHRKEIERNLRMIFEFQKNRLTIDISRKRDFSPLTFCITGASGFIGQELSSFLTCIGHKVITVGRGENNDIIWNPDAEEKPDTDLTADIFIHLAGENISAKRWTTKQKKYLLRNREQSVRSAIHLAKTMGAHSLIVASAVGYYGHRPNTPLTETSEKGTLFASDLCKAIEDTSLKECPENIRLIIPRFGAVISPKGGALKRMLPIFRLGLGGPIGSGHQHMPWISLDDAVSALYHLATKSELSGAINLTSPQKSTFKEFSQELGKALKRPTFIPLPTFMAKVIFGEMAENILLADTQVLSSKLQSDGYKFLCPTLASALRWQIFGRGPIIL